MERTEGRAVHFTTASFSDADVGHWFNDTTLLGLPRGEDPVAAGMAAALLGANGTDNATLGLPVDRAAPMRHLSITLEVVLTACYAVGIAGNLAALVILVRGGKRAHRNRRHSLMLRCLACNDLLALVGMLIMMQAQLRLPPSLTNARFFCALRVVWRLFGLGSGSVALVMAAERWLALTRPFLYQKRVTYHTVRRAIFTLWGCVVLLVLLPLGGFGLYYNPHATRRCLRYHSATEPWDVAYAFVYFTVGMLLIVSIVCCNLLVMRRLCHGHGSWGRSRGRSWGWEQSQQGQQGLLRAVYRPTPEKDTAQHLQQQHQLPPMIRRISRASSRMRVRLQHTESVDSATHEETAFAKMMALLCVLFVVCWLPQMMTIPLLQLWPNSFVGQRFSRAADFSLLLHFTLDPFVYVLQRCTRRHSAPPPPPLLAAPALEPEQPATPLKRLCATLGDALRGCSCCSCGCSGRQGRHPSSDSQFGDHSLTHYNSSANGMRSVHHPLSAVAL